MSISICELSRNDEENIYGFLLKFAYRVGAAYILHQRVAFQDALPLTRSILVRSSTHDPHKVPNIYFSSSATVGDDRAFDLIAKWYHSVSDKDFA